MVCVHIIYSRPWQIIEPKMYQVFKMFKQNKIFAGFYFLVCNFPFLPQHKHNSCIYLLNISSILIFHFIFTNVVNCFCLNYSLLSHLAHLRSTNKWGEYIISLTPWRIFSVHMVGEAEVKLGMVGWAWLVLIILSLWRNKWTFVRKSSA